MAYRKIRVLALNCGCKADSQANLDALVHFLDEKGVWDVCFLSEFGRGGAKTVPKTLHTLHVHSPGVGSNKMAWLAQGCLPLRVHHYHKQPVQLSH